MAKNLDKEGLSSIVDNYQLFYIDLWGVVHNGIELYENSINVLDNLAAAKKEFVLLTNAPRPNLTVISFLKKIGLKKYFENEIRLETVEVHRKTSDDFFDRNK